MPTPLHLPCCQLCVSSMGTDSKLQAPHGGKLVDLMLAEDKKAAAIASCTKELELSDRNACDVELLMVGYVCPALLCASVRV